MPQQPINKKLLVITVEEVLLVTASGGVKSEFEPTYTYTSEYGNSYPVFLRPQLLQFLNYCLSNFRVALWSELSPDFVQDALERLYGEKYNSGMFEFIWDADKCVKPSDDRYVVEGYVHRHLCKSFDKVLEAGYSEDEIIIVDVNPKHWEPVYGIARSSWVYATSISKVFGNISIGGEPYSPDDTSILDVIGELEKCDSGFYLMAPIHRPENGAAYVLASDVSAEELPYLKAMSHGGQCPVPDGLKEGDSAFYEADYLRWYDWRIEHGTGWRKKAESEWWFEFVQA